jgi:hypothetical protein
MEAQQYYDSLMAQGYPSEEAEKYTREHYPEFSLAPTAPAPVMIDTSAPMPMGAGMPAPMPMPASLGMSMQDSVIAGDVNHNATTLNNFTTNQHVVIVGKDKSKAWRTSNGILGVFFSLIMFGYSYWVKGLWDDMKTDLDDFRNEISNSLLDDMDSMVSTFSLLYTVIMLMSVCMLAVSIIQFMNKPWGSKAFLGMAVLLFITLMFTGYYETTSANALFDEVNEDLSPEEQIGEISFAESNGAIGGYCSGFCLLFFGIFALLGRPKGPVVELQM